MPFLFRRHGGQRYTISMPDIVSTPPMPPSRPQGASGLLGPNDPPVYEIFNPGGDTPLLLLCDHASNVVPASLDQLGLDDATFERHVAYDIGAAALTRILSERLNAPALLSGYSRLVIDVNRQPGDPGSIPEVSDDIEIPGNKGLSEVQKVERAEVFHWPYHHAITNAVGHLWAMGKPPAVFSIHSFTPHMSGERRPWDAGVLWNRDPRIAVPMINFLRQNEHLVIGDNEPYSGKEIAYSIDQHAGTSGLPNCAIEIRQDLVATENGIGEWADHMTAALKSILSMDTLFEVEHF
ncbi:MAG: N-formylglutamate amidohydrolase [Rhodospirillales bacterium]|nr:N-formylglutamate amidohydrolase [Rhodospirillales bacterium]MCW8861895.1 N-formylglutamate amidohydrolase [Rhodospirillales bacterium]MCW8952482.1 N-formylglutamate amidohydrolase [Rhodospirillales bacterium]MCW8969732.1 N-formylglutamate amidohydrolase [Rhodospirillales bacterium]MCW9003363.1 N-formylglutamate amidohydrolase [Rhodospirillales bacterium]